MTIPMCQLTTLPMHSDSHPDCRRVLTLIDALQVVANTRRIRLPMSSAHPHQALFRQVALRLDSS